MPTIERFEEGALVKTNVSSLRLYKETEKGVPSEPVWLENGDYLLTLKIDKQIGVNDNKEITRIYFLHLRSGQIGVYYYYSNTQHYTLYFDEP